MAPTPTLSPQALYQQGLDWRAAWNLETALTRFDAALALAPDMAPAYASRAELHRLAGRYDEAAADIDKALALDPELAEAWRQKALLSRIGGAWEEALNAANKLIELQPDDGAAYILRAQIYADGFEESHTALDNYNRAIARNPIFDKATLVERWHIMAALQRWRDALRISQKMFATGSEDPLRYFYQSWSLIQLGRLDDAIQTLFFGLKRYPDYPVALYYALGVAYYERRAWLEAIQALEVALAQSSAPSSENAPWRHLDVTETDILGRMGISYLSLGQCETGAAIVERAAVGDPEAWGWVGEQIEACYISLTPTPTPTGVPTP